MRVKIIFLFSLFFQSYFLVGQECGTRTDSTPQHFEISGKTLIDNNYPVCIDVSFHIVRNTNGSGGYNIANILGIVNLLNDYFNPHNIYIRNAGIDYINNTTYYNIDSDPEFDALVQINNVPNAINFYLVNYGPWGGRADGILSNSLVVINSNALTLTSPHEVGHCLNLWHTHQSTAPSCPENINGSNCLTCGDFICDTPADPNLLGNINSNCVYTGGGGYNPDVTNIMSYGGSCRDNFTLGQGTRMRAALISSPILQQVRSNQCSITKIVGPDIICDTTPKTYTIQNMISGTAVTWQVPSNYFQVNTSSNTSITLSAINIPANGITVSITAMLPTNSLHKEIRMGKPAEPLVDGPLIVAPSHTAIYEVINHTDESEYDWTFPQGWDYNPYVSGPIAWGKPLFAGQNGYITVVATNDCGVSDMVSFYVTAQAGGGGDPKMPEQTNFIITPNPAFSKITIVKNRNSSLEGNIETMVSANNITSLVLYDKYGVIVKNKKTGNLLELDVSNLNEDIYFLKFITEKNIEVHRIIIKN